MRVLHAPVNVGNQPWTLSRYERELGLESDVWVNYQTWLGYKADRVISEAGKKSAGAFARRAYHCVAAPLRYDVLHYYFGRTLASWDDWPGWARSHWDLSLAKKLGRRIFFTLQGCDIRMASASNRENAITPCRPGGCSAFETCIASIDQNRMWLRDELLPQADHVFYLNPELGRDAGRGSFLPYGSVPVDNIGLKPPRTEGAIRVVHAPTDRTIKGTNLILPALESLKQHYEIEIVVVENRPHQEALRLFASADICIDQIHAGWYGALAVEMMAMGKPVVCYLRESDFDILPRSLVADLPLVNTTPTTIKDDLNALFAARADWPALSLASRSYVERWHHPAKLARALKAAYEQPEKGFDLEAHAV